MLFNSSKKTPHDAAQQISDARKMLDQLRPLAEKIHHHAALRFFSGSMQLISEYLYYLLALGCLVFMFIMDSVFPFHLLGEITHRPVFRTQISNAQDIESFNFAVRALVALAGILWFMLGLKKRAIRKQNQLMHQAGALIKKTEQYFSEKLQVLEKLQLEQGPLPETEHDGN